MQRNQLNTTNMTLEELRETANNNEFHKFINTHMSCDTNKLRLKSHKDCDFDVNYAILQIECKNRIKKKLPELFGKHNFLFPNTLSTEQCTAESIAKFHASLLSPNASVLDLTAGLCIDAYYISKSVKSVTALEINPETAIVSKFNMDTHTDNVTVICEDCNDFIKNTSQHYDVIFIDPARRGSNNKRLFGLSDCEPNVLELIPSIKKLTDTLYIKASPMLDITQSIKELNNKVSDIWVNGINNECKEVLFKIELNNNSEILSPNIHTFNFENDAVQHFSSVYSKNHVVSFPCKTPEVNEYLYEPNRCIMKAQVYDALESEYNISRIHNNSHLFVNEILTEDFPGRRFIITSIIPFKSNAIKSISKSFPQINVSVRNFRLSAEELKKKLKVNDGGNNYLFGTTDKDNNAILLICKKA